MKQLATTLMFCLALAGCGGGTPVAPETPLDIADSALRAGVTHYRHHEYRSAQRMFAQSLTRYRSLDDPNGMIVALINLGDVSLLLGEPEAASAYAERARFLMGRDELIERFGQRIDLLQASAAMQVEDYATASEMIDALLPVPDPDNGEIERSGIGDAALVLRAQLAIARNDADVPFHLQRVTALTIDEDASPLLVGREARLRAEYAHRNGDTEGASAAYREALAAYRNAQDRPGIATTLEAWSGLMIEQADWGGARDLLERALNIRLWINDRVHSLADMRALVQVTTEQGDTERAAELELWSQALDVQGDVDWRAMRAELTGT